MKLLLCLACLLALASCTWVKDDVADCPYGFWLRLRYTYNILDVEAAPRYVTDAYIYVYDADGNYVRRIYVTQGELAANGYRVEVDGLPEGDYQFVVWSGIGHSQYAVSGDTQTIGDFRLSLAAPLAPGTGLADQLPALFHGYLPPVHYDDSYRQYDVDLTKDTNQLACAVVIPSQPGATAPDDFTMSLTAANGVMDAYNRLATAATTVYEPYASEPVTLDDADYGELRGTKFSISTLRLMGDDDCRMVIRKKSTGQSLVNLSFPEYVALIGSFYTQLGRQISMQEYLDRQDFYTLVFYLSADLDQLVQLQVNSWRLRAFNHLKL